MNRTIITLVEDPETGDLILPLDHEIFAEMGWQIGDVVEWIDNNDGSWTLRKKEIKNASI
jgi:hypothetical protein